MTSRDTPPSVADLASCPYLLGEGSCTFGCRTEPQCWEIERAAAAAAKISDTPNDVDMIKEAVRKRRDKDPEFVERVRKRVEQDAELLRLLADS